MGKIVASLFVSLDGVMEDPGGSEKFIYGGWTRPYWNNEIAKVKYDELFASDALLLGRVTYQGFAAAWPAMHDEFADRMNGLPKYVVSSTLEQLPWNNSHRLGGNFVAEVARLKQQTGRDILIAGSARLVNALIPTGLIDEFTLLVYPVVLGSGKRLFQEGSNAGLSLVASRSFSSGVALLHYHVERK